MTHVHGTSRQTPPSDAPAASAAGQVCSGPLIGWRMLALLYDALPVLALWMVVGTLFTIGYTLAGHSVRENIQPFSAVQWIEWACCWLITGAYAVLSWRRGGQTLGMRAWRLRVRARQGGPAPVSALWIRYATGTVSVLAGGLGFWWAWVDRDRLTWHDRASNTVLQREPKPRPDEQPLA